MNPQLQMYHTLLNQALSEGIRKNDDQTKIWTEYRKRHVKVIEALKVLPLEISVNCMVPIGRKAMMKGKLTHTNEVLVCLGSEYFAKYSASNAMALCNRRIKQADERLKSLEKERNLYEMRKIIPEGFDVFGNDHRKDIREHWKESEVESWKIQHRQKEKEYHQKLFQLKTQQKTEIKTEDDLFQRLDQLELEEEINDEFNRLHGEQMEYYGDELNEGEVYYESDEEDDSYDEITNEMLQEELENRQKIELTTDAKNSSPSSLPPKDNSLCDTSKNCDKLIDDCTIRNNENTDVKKTRKVSFAELNLEDNINRDLDKSLLESEKRSSKEKIDITPESDDSEDIIRIEFEHSTEKSHHLESQNDTIESPRDIYRIFNRRKSILKRSSHEILISPTSTVTLPEYSTDDETEDESDKPSAYKCVVKDIQERHLSTVIKKSNVQVENNKPMSKFKLERASKRK